MCRVCLLFLLFLLICVELFSILAQCQVIVQTPLSYYERWVYSWNVIIEMMFVMGFSLVLYSSKTWSMLFAMPGRFLLVINGSSLLFSNLLLWTNIAYIIHWPLYYFLAMQLYGWFVFFERKHLFGVIFPTYLFYMMIVNNLPGSSLYDWNVVLLIIVTIVFLFVSCKMLINDIRVGDKVNIGGYITLLVSALGSLIAYVVCLFRFFE